MLVAIDSFCKKVAAMPLKDRLATTTATAMKTIIDRLGVPAQVYSDDEFKKEFKQLLDDWAIEKQVTRGHAFCVERVICTIKAAILLRLAQMGRRGQWHLLLPDITAQINNRVHTATEVTPNKAYSDPAWESIRERAKNTAEPRPLIRPGDRVKIRLKPQESRAAYRVNKLKWSEKVYRVLGVEQNLLVRRDIRKIAKVEDVGFRGLEVQSRQRRRQQAQDDRLPPMI